MFYNPFRRREHWFVAMVKKVWSRVTRFARRRLR